MPFGVDDARVCRASEGIGMKPYVLSVVPEDVLSFFSDVSRVVEGLEDVTLPEGRELSCHMLTRALSARMHNKKSSSVRLRTRTGLFNGRYTHSWLLVSSVSNPGSEWIIDAYPVGALAGSRCGVLLWDASVVTNLYEYLEATSESVRRSPDFARCVRATSDAVSRTKKALGL